MMVAMTDHIDYIDDLIEFVAASPSSYHAAAEVARRLRAAGATEISETDQWPSAPGTYVMRRDGAAVAWIVPEGNLDSAEAAFGIVGSHTDSPGFRVKPHPQTSAVGYRQVAVEIYGGALLGAWTDREIEFAGRVVDRSGKVHLVRTGPIARIPQLAIHLNRTVNAEGLKLDPQRHTAPVIALENALNPATGILDVLADRAGVPAEDLVAWDLISADTQRPAIFGAQRDFLASGRLDNLLSVHASLVAFEHLLADGSQHQSLKAGLIPLMVAFDHEEVGSASTTGAAGPLLSDVLARISTAAGFSEEQRAQVYRRSVCLSADGAHAVHPNYVGEHEPGHHPVLDGGPVVKLNANQRYATDAVGQALVARLAAEASKRTGEEIPVQYFVSSNQQPCGSTIGPITATRIGIQTVDLGAAMLSMHSPREMCGVRDPKWLSDVLLSLWLER